ncbi:hypothetical protein ACJMK2_007009, partial [Sinanodonta woodiana]
QAVHVLTDMDMMDMTIFLLLLFCFTEDKAVTANDNECSFINESEAGGYFYLDGETVRFGCVKRIKTNKGFYIKLSLESSSTSVVDVSEFRDGTKSHAQILHVGKHMLYESNENEIEVKMPANAASLKVHWLRECGKLHNQTEQFFEVTGPSIMSGYPNHSKCTWEVLSNSDYRIMLEVKDIRGYNQTLGDCSSDYVQVTGKLMGETQSTATCLTDRTLKYYYYSPVNILFFSDSKSDSGIIFSFRTSLVKFLKEYQGRIASPGYPASYPNKSLVTWIIQVPMGFRTQLIFDDFHLEKEEKGKCYDFVKVIEPKQSEVNKRESGYCGTSMVNTSRTSGKHIMEVIFFSDQGHSDTGFSAHWVAVCGGTLEGNSGELIGPNNASGYPENQTCIWNTRVRNGYRMLLTLNVTGYTNGTNCSLDHIQVDEGQSEINRKRLCSGALTLESTKSVTIIFHSDSDPTTGISFNASWLSKCGETFESNSGELSSPDYPADYDHDVKCDWTIRVLPGHTITLNYSLQNTSNNEKLCTPYVQVIEIDSSASKILCKSNSFAVHRSSSNTLHISLTHEPTMNYTKFYAKWHAEKLQGKSSSGYSLENEVYESPLSVSVKAAAAPTAFVIVVLIIFLIVKRKKRTFCFAPKAEVATYDTKEIIYDSISEKDMSVKTGNNIPLTKNISHFSTMSFEPETFRRRLPNPPMNRMSSVIARVRKSMHFLNQRDRECGAATKRGQIAYIGEHIEFHGYRHDITHSKQERFQQGLQSTWDSLSNQGYISAVEVDQRRKECACSGHIDENDCVICDPSDNEGYITAMHSSAMKRSPSSVDSDSINSMRYTHAPND